MQNKERMKALFREFSRYLVVGGTAFLVDYGVLYLSKTFLFDSIGDTGVYLATALGFLAGLTYNYILSLIWVFQSAKDQKKGRTVGAFLVFAVIGAIGLLLTEGGMFLGYQLLHMNYMVVKLFVAAFVLLWNYGARKILIFRDDKSE
ncbi:MAG: GtrA family protein [Eubacteriales bacterium]|nr:GtrA family protein [Eubacteriales bacterium]